MTLKELINRRDEISFAMLEADSNEYADLTEELGWIEEQIEELEGGNSEVLDEEEVYEG